MTNQAPRRHVLLIRHGQYQEEHLDDIDRKLTPLGKLEIFRDFVKVASKPTRRALAWRSFSLREAASAARCEGRFVIFEEAKAFLDDDARD